MVEELILAAKNRTLVGKKVNQLRRSGDLPAVLYGKEIKTQNLTLNEKEFQKIFQKAGTTTLVNLTVEDGKPVKVLIHEPQFNPINDKIIHTDFYQVKMSEKIHAEIPLKFVGEAPAVKELDGNLITNKTTLAVECLPDDLVSEIEIDISKLKTFEDFIHIKDIKVPEKITVLAEAEEVVALVEAPRTEEELEKELAAETKEEEKAAIESIEAQTTVEAAEKTAEGEKSKLE